MSLWGLIKQGSATLQELSTVWNLDDVARMWAVLLYSAECDNQALERQRQQNK